MNTRGRMINLIDSRPWDAPDTLTEARRFHATLRPLWELAATLHDDRLSALFPLRLDVFLAHWPAPPHDDNALARFRADTRGLCRHDVPRLRHLMATAPVELPEHRTPRLAVVTLHTIA